MERLAEILNEHGRSRTRPCMFHPHPTKAISLWKEKTSAQEEEERSLTVYMTQ